MTPLELLDKMPLFNGLDKKIIKHFHANTNRREVKKGEIICTPDDDAHNFYIIHSGWVKLFKDTQDGQEAILDILSRFGIFGEDSLFGKRDYGWYAEAVEDVVLLSIPVNILKDAIRKYPDLAVNMITAMSESKRKLDNEVEHFMLQNAPQRLGCFLLKLVQQSEWDNTTQCLGSGLIESTI